MTVVCVFKQASPLPRAAHIGVSWVQRAAQSNQDAKKQQDGRALQGRHGPEGKEKQRLTVDICYICDWLMEQATVTNLSFKPLLFNHTVENILQLEFYTRCFVFALLWLALHSLEDGKIHWKTGLGHPQILVK